MPCIRSAVLALSLPLLAHATKPQHAVWQSYSDFAAGKCLSTSLSEDGVLAAAPANSKIAELGADEAWSVVARPNGTIVVGTAPEGKLLQVTPDGTVKLLAKFDESHLYALALGPHGELYVGTSPDGKVYQVAPDGKTQVWFDPAEKYIWALAVAPDGKVYVGTGTKGKIYRVTAKGEGELWYASNETHIRSLAFDRSGALLAGSAESGYLYRVTAKNQAVVSAGTGREEVNQIQTRPDGTIYFTATGTAKDASGKGPPAKKSADGGTGSTGGATDPGNSALYRLTEALAPEVVWSTKDILLSLAWNGQEGGAIVGAANDGYTYAVSSRGAATRLARIEASSITAMASAGGDTILATSNPGRLFRASHEKSHLGLYESDVVDSQSFARWGAITLDASEPTEVHIFTRSGNTSPPDKTWYPWLAATGGRAQSEPARYLQVQLEIEGGRVDKIDASYLPKNEPPHIETLKILPAGIGYFPAPALLLSPTPQSAAQLLSGGGAPDPATPTRYQVKNAHGLRTLVWKASDPNNDDLTYNVFWRKVGETDWQNLAKNITENLLTWDTSRWREGRYELKVVASDAGANAPGEGLTDVAISRAMIVDNTPPVIKIVSQTADAVEFTVQDELSGLQSVAISTDGKSYQPLAPVNGILDSGPDHFRAPISNGQMLFIRAEDAGGNVANSQTGK